MIGCELANEVIVSAVKPNHARDVTVTRVFILGFGFSRRFRMLVWLLADFFSISGCSPNRESKLFRIVVLPEFLRPQITHEMYGIDGILRNSPSFEFYVVGGFWLVMVMYLINKLNAFSFTSWQFV